MRRHKSAKRNCVALHDFHTPDFPYVSDYIVQKIKSSLLYTVRPLQRLVTKLIGVLFGVCPRSNIPSLSVDNLASWKKVWSDRVVWVERQFEDVNVSAFFVFWMDKIAREISTSAYTAKPMKFQDRRLEWLTSCKKTMGANSNLVATFGLI